MRLSGSLSPDDYADEVARLYMNADINHKSFEFEDMPRSLNVQELDNIIFQYGPYKNLCVKPTLFSIHNYQ